VFAWNEASCRVLEKAGFEREACMRHWGFKDGQLVDAFQYARLRG
jgi:RimJ/RimL family protein N-acetyltransferase